MFCLEEENLIKMNLELFELHEDKEKKFLEIWNEAKITMEEKLKYNKSLLEVLMRCCSFLTYLSFCEEEAEEIKTNQMEKFMRVENPLRNFKMNQIRLLNLHEFFKYLKKILVQNHEKDEQFKLPREIIQDFSFSDTLYKKCEEFMNLFFDNHTPYFLNLKKLIWTCYIYFRAKLINHSRNLLECLPMLISVISFFLMDIEDQRFNRSFFTMVDEEVKLFFNQSGSLNFNELDSKSLFRQKKKDCIINVLHKKAEQRIESISLINQLILKNLRELPELSGFFLNSGDINTTKNCFNLSDENVIFNLTEIFKNQYEKYLKLKNFDGRIFLMEKNVSNCSPVKLTPFKRQKILNQDFNIKKPSSFKTLDFVNFDTTSKFMEKEMMDKPITKNFNNFAMNLDYQQKSSSSFRGFDVKELAQKLNTNNIEMTPCTKIMLMDKWVKEYTRDWNIDKLIRLENLCNTSIENTSRIDVNSIISGYLKTVEKLFTTYKVRVLTQIEEIKILTYKIICGLIKRDERKFKADFISRILFNQNFLKSALIVGVEIVLLIENVDEISFFKLADVLDLDLYEFWKIINPFLNFDLTIPTDIKLHFNEIELQLMSFMIWKKANNNFKDELNEYFKDYSYVLQDKDLKEIEDIEFNNQSLFVYQDQNIFRQENIIDLMSPSSTTENSSTSLNYSNTTNLSSYKNIKPIYIFLRRILNYSIFLNKKITDNLSLNKETAKECENLLKKIIDNRNYLEILFNRHIDQIIVCAIIAIMKLRNLYDERESMKSIIAAYSKLKPDNSENQFKSLFYNIKLYAVNISNNTSNTSCSSNQTHRTMNISEFCEEIFTKKLEDLLQQLKEEDEGYLLSVKKKRKFSVPDSEIRKFQFEEETAFENSTIMYEPLSKTIFSKQINRGVIPVLESPIRNGYLSLRCSPMMGMYQSPNVNRTPRTIKVREAYKDYPSLDEVISLSAQNVFSSGNNQYKNNLKKMLSGTVVKHQIGELNSAEKNNLNENNSISNSLLSDVNDFSLGYNYSFNNSQNTPEFKKTSKDN